MAAAALVNYLLDFDEDDMLEWDQPLGMIGPVHGPVAVPDEEPANMAEGDDGIGAYPEVQDGLEWQALSTAGYTQQGWDHWDLALHVEPPQPQGLHSYAAAAAAPLFFCHQFEEFRAETRTNLDRLTD